MVTLTVNEIFLSIQGEGTRAGRCCALVRLTGCNLCCSWCDTRYALDEGHDMSLDRIMLRVGELRCPMVELTGGEPLIQAGAPELLRRLCDEGYETLLETNGSLDISPVDPRVARIVDFKCPSSGQQAANRWDNVELLTGRDEVKFVLADRADYEYAVAAANRHRLSGRCPVIFAPVFGKLPLGNLAQWMIADILPVRLGVQLHKIIWPHKDRGV